MQKLKSFQQFATEVQISNTRKIEEEAIAKRNNEAETFKNLLSKFNVTSVKELTEDQRSEFFTKLRDAEINEAVTLIEEGTRGQFGKIDKKGNITSIYTHYDSYPENMLPIIKKSFKNSKAVDAVIAKGDCSGLETSIDKINFYGDSGNPSTGNVSNVSKYLRDVANNGGAEFVYLWDEANKEWLMADIYGNGYDELVPAFESVSVSVNEAIAVQFKRDAKKVVTVYNNLFAKKLTDFGAMSNESVLGCIKYLFEYAMEDANFSREGFAISKNIKGAISSYEVKMPGLGGYYIKIGATTTKRILDQYYSDIANAAGWSGIGIVEGTALYLEQIKQEAAGQSLLNAFNMFNESTVVEDKDRLVSVNEAEVNSDEEFNEYAITVLQKAFGEEFDEAKAKKVIDGILAKADGDYGTAVGMLTSSLGESVTNEAIDTKYWADYNTDTSGQGNKEFANKSKDFEDTFEDAVVYWNQEADGAENRIKGTQIQTIKKLAQEFFKKEGYISINIVQAMIAQES